MAKAVAKVAAKSKPAAQLPASLITELEHRRAGMAKACEAGLDLFLATAREARPATQEELRRVAQLGILQARSSQSVEPILAAYRIAARVARASRRNAGGHHAHRQLRLRGARPGCGRGHQDLLARARAAHAARDESSRPPLPRLDQ